MTMALANDLLPRSTASSKFWIGMAHLVIHGGQAIPQSALQGRGILCHAPVQLPQRQLLQPQALQ